MYSYLRGAGHSTCKLCKGSLHPGISCWEARYRRREEQKREEEFDFYVGYYDEQNWYDESDDPRLTQSLSYQVEYEYEDYYNYYSQPSCQDYQVEYCNYQQDYSQPAYEDHQSHKSESLDEMMRKRHMAHIEQELTKPQLSMEDRLELLEWKYDLLPKEVKEVRPGMSIWEKRQVKQEWLSVQIEQMVVEELKDEHDMSDEEGKVVTPPEFEDEYLEIIIEEPPMEDKIVEEPPMESKVEGLLLDEPIKVDYNSPAVVVMETKSVKDACLETRKVALHDVGDFIHKLCLWESLDLLGTENEVVKWRVNYRAFVGNSVGKCGFKEFCKERWDVTKHTYNRRIKHRAYISNEKGKCALRPP